MFVYHVNPEGKNGPQRDNIKKPFIEPFVIDREEEHQGPNISSSRTLLLKLSSRESRGGELSYLYCGKVEDTWLT